MEEYIFELIGSLVLTAVLWIAREVHNIRVDMATWVTTTKSIEKLIGQLQEQVQDLSERVARLATKISLVESESTRLSEAQLHLDEWLGRVASRMAAVESRVSQLEIREESGRSSGPDRPA